MSMSGTFTSGKPGDAPAKAGAVSAAPTHATAQTLVTPSIGADARPEAPARAGVRSGSSFNAQPIPQRMIKCPKCAADAREVARFCPRCHATLRFECPACKHEQRKGGACEKCGIDFVKYIGAVIAGKKAQADQVHDRIEQRTNMMKHVLLLPVTGGLSLFRYFRPRKKLNSAANPLS
jgi:hypothetical protein